MSSEWNFCHWAADVPPRETSLSGEEKRLPLAGYKTVRGYHLTGCEKSGDKIGCHCLFWSPSQSNVITFETHPLHPWKRFFEGLDRGGWGGGWSLSLRGLLKLTHWHSLQTHWKPLLESPFNTVSFFLKEYGEHLPKKKHWDLGPAPWRPNKLKGILIPTILFKEVHLGRTWQGMHRIMKN